MKFSQWLTGLAALLVPLRELSADEMTLALPGDYEVVQRFSAEKGSIAIAGEMGGGGERDVAVEARWRGEREGEWHPLEVHWNGGRFTTKMEAPAGGWYRVDVRAMREGQVVAERSVEHVGVGEVFVVAGQSNSANYGEEKQTTQTGRVTALDGRGWQLANDPQPGAAGSRGSFMPPLGDALEERFHVPIGFVACGVGGTSVREWLPQGVVFPNPPTVESRVVRLAGGTWESKGQLYAKLLASMKAVGPHGFRAVLWHQGESDANQQDTSRTLPGKLYREYLEKIIRESRREVGWDAPWFVAQASYHTPADEGSPDLRAAQASLWQDGVALEGPDTDALKSAYREKNGQGVHFTGAGLREHAARWVEKLAPWLEEQLKTRAVR
ncbi:sialate O-acetylesterase [Chthoniobacter flavus]|nr:sialate O-acetylesterase [Chthoniobacter flavus]